MIPMLTLGIPGDAVTAIMLNALIVQNVQPGPCCFGIARNGVSDFRQSVHRQYIDADTGLFAARYLSTPAADQKSILLPIICILSVIGAYALRNSMFDVWVAVLFGVIGYGMKRWAFRLADCACPDSGTNGGEQSAPCSAASGASPCSSSRSQFPAYCC